MSDYVEICKLRRGGQLEVFESLLREAGIPYNVDAGHLSMVYGIASPTPIRVPEERYDDARAVLDGFLDEEE